MSTLLGQPGGRAGLAERLAGPTILQLIAPPGPLVPTICLQVAAALHSLNLVLPLELHAWADGVVVGVRTLPDQRAAVERAIRGAAPAWEVTATEVPAPAGRLRYLSRLERPDTPPWAPLRAVGALEGADPVGALLEAIQPLDEDERLLIRYLVRPVGPRQRREAHRGLTSSALPRSVLGLALLLVELAPRVPRFEAARQRMLEQRLVEPAFQLLGAVALAGNERRRLESRAGSLTAALRGPLDAGYGGLVLGSWSWRAGPDNLPLVWPAGQSGLYLTAGELASCWHPPAGGLAVPGVVHLRRPPGVLAPRLLHADGLVLGSHRQRGQQVAVRLPAADLRAGHAMVIGKTGVGKSTLQHQLLRQLAALPERPAVVLVDPHGDLALDLARRSVPPTREADTLLLELGDVACPVGIPLFRRPAGVDETVFAQTVFSLLRLLFRDAWSSSRMEDLTWALTATLVRLPGATLRDVPRLFGDPPFRRRALAQVDDPVALEAWGDFERLSESGRLEAARPILYRLRALYRAPGIRDIVCRTDGLDVGELLEQQAIILVSLAGPAIQAEADLLGELVIARLHLALLGRLALPPEMRRPVYLAIDESHRFQGASLPLLLSEGRKLGLGLMLSTQFVSNWSEALVESVLGNVGTLVAFRCGPSDARRLAAGLRPFSADQVEDLDRYEAIVKLQLDGTTLPAFDLQTLPLTGSADEAVLERIRSQTRARYGQIRQAVERGGEPGIERPTDRPGDTPRWDALDVDEE